MTLEFRDGRLQFRECAPGERLTGVLMLMFTIHTGVVVWDNLTLWESRQIIRTEFISPVLPSGVRG